MAAQHTFSATRRLRRRAEFQRVFDTGRRVHGRYLTLIAAPAPGETSRLGIVASRKLGGAVVRNRAKRLIREAFRLSNLSDPALDLVVIPKGGLVAAPFADVATDFHNTFTRGFGRVSARGNPS